MAWGKCKLCLKNKLLIGKSHIIPNFMYKGLFDEDNKIILANLKNTKAKDRIAHTGYFDKHILCHECETSILGKLDNYAASVIFAQQVRGKTKKEIIKSTDGILSLKVSNVDSEKLKLFILSILWRSHISGQSFFKEVNIGIHEEIIRTKILTGNDDKKSDYNVMIFGIIDKEGHPVRLISDPIAKETPAGWIALFFIQGFLYQINLGANKEDAKFSTFYLKPVGEISIPLVSGILGRQMLKSLGLPDYIINYFTLDK